MNKPRGILKTLVKCSLRGHKCLVLIVNGVARAISQTQLRISWLAVKRLDDAVHVPYKMPSPDFLIQQSK